MGGRLWKLLNLPSSSILAVNCDLEEDELGAEDGELVVEADLVVADPDLAPWKECLPSPLLYWTTTGSPVGRFSLKSMSSVAKSPQESTTW